LQRGPLGGEKNRDFSKRKTKRGCRGKVTLVAPRNGPGEIRYEGIKKANKNGKSRKLNNSAAMAETGTEKSGAGE